MPLSQGRILNTLNGLQATPNNDYTVPMGRSTEQLMSELNPKYYTQAYLGNMFIGTAVTAAAIPVTSTTSPNFNLWNPAGSGVNLVLVRYTAGWVATTEAPGNILLSYSSNAGNTVATGAVFTAFTNSTPVSSLVGASPANKARFGVAATLTAAPTVFYTLGQSHLTTTGTATFGTFSIVIDFDGSIIVPPGTAVFTTASAATASTYNQSLIWYELPV